MIDERYILGDVIGSGGMSVVYSAEDNLLGRHVAVKVLRQELARDVNFRERFRREAQNSGRLNHPNIVSVYDTGETDYDGLAIPYIVMERVQGRTLRDIMREDGRLSPSEAGEIMSAVAQALQASHEAGIIHRDVKPANIMLTNTGQVKVMDFGIARALDDSSSAMTQTSAVIGTAQYLSPEQARGKPADARSDVYALGCVLYEAITGHVPFEGETPFAVAYQHVQEEPVVPSEHLHNDGLSPTTRLNVDGVILTAMAKHPADRYQSAQEISEDLDRLSRGAVTRAARAHIDDSSAAHAATKVENSDAYPATSAMPPLSPTGAPVPAAASEPEDVDDDDKGGSAWTKWLTIILGLILVGILAGVGWAFFQGDKDSRASRDGDSGVSKNIVIVPEVEDRPRDEIVSELEDLGLQVKVNEEANPKIERDRAIRINPAPGSELQKNSSVTLTISSGKEITDVPDISGMTLEEASQALESAGLQLNNNVTEETSNSVAAGNVISQNPPAGTQLSKGSEVSVTISTGRDQVSVPSLAGMKVGQATSTLESLGLKADIRTIDAVEAEGQVLSNSHQNQKADRGSTITVEVSNGMLIEAPSLVGKSEQEALRALRDAGWEGSASNLREGAPISTGSAVDNGRIGWSDLEDRSYIRKDATIEVRYWDFDLANLFPG